MKLHTSLIPFASWVLCRRAPAPRAEIIEQILVKVNGEIFTKTDLETRQVAALRQQGPADRSEDDPSNAQLRKALDEITPQIMVDAVDEMLIVQRGKELGYKLSDEQFKSVLDNIKKENKIETEEQFQAALKQENMTMADLRRNLERQMIFSARAAERSARPRSPSPTTRRAATTTRTSASSRRRRPSRCARSWSPCRATPRCSTSAADEAAKAKAEAIRQRAVDHGRELREARGRGVRRAVEGQRRADRPAQRAATCRPRSAEAHRGDEGGRRQPGGADAARLPDLQARDDRRRPRRCRSTRRASRSASTCSPTSGKAEFEKYLDKLRGAGDHRVEERGRAEGVRSRA